MQLHLDGPSGSTSTGAPTSPTRKGSEEKGDFFDEVEFSARLQDQAAGDGEATFAEHKPRQRQPSSEGPNVELALTMTPEVAAEQFGDLLQHVAASRKPVSSNKKGKESIGNTKHY